MKKIILLAATILSLATVSPSVAMSDGALCDNATGRHMSIAKVKSSMTAKGYRVRRVKRENGCLEVYAIDKQGSKVEIYLHPVSGKIVKIKNKS